MAPARHDDQDGTPTIETARHQTIAAMVTVAAAAGLVVDLTLARLPISVLAGMAATVVTVWLLYIGRRIESRICERVRHAAYAEGFVDGVARRESPATRRLHSV